MRLKRIENDIEYPIYMLESKKFLSVYRNNSWERYLENGQVVINSDFFHSKLKEMIPC